MRSGTAISLWIDTKEYSSYRKQAIENIKFHSNWLPVWRSHRQRDLPRSALPARPNKSLDLPSVGEAENPPGADSDAGVGQ